MRIAGRRKILILLFAAVFLMSSVFPATAMVKSVFGGEDMGGDADFTVQYYANVPEYSDEATGSPLTVIGTSSGILPENSDGPDDVKTTQIYLDEDGRVKMDDTLAPIYTEERFSYYRAPGLNYFDKVSLSSANYDLKEIWVMKDSCDDPASIDYEDWTMYVDVDICPVQFTNDPENAGQTGTVTDSSRPGGDVVPGSEGRMILIEDDTVIRLVYDTNSNTDYDRDAAFFDYDITDGIAYTGRETHIPSDR